MASTIKVPVDTNTPGVITEVHQRLDLNLLETSQFNRLINAAKSGLVTGGRGFFAQLVDTLSTELNTMPPFIIGLASSWHGMTVAHPWMREGSIAEEQVNELMKLSDMRHRMQMAAEGETNKNRHTRDRKANRQHSHWMVGNHYVQLYGWKSTTDVRKFLAKNLCNHPLMKESRVKLTAALMDKPTVNIVTKEF